MSWHRIKTDAHNHDFESSRKDCVVIRGGLTLADISITYALIKEYERSEVIQRREIMTSEAGMVREGSK